MTPATATVPSPIRSAMVVDRDTSWATVSRACRSSNSSTRLRPSRRPIRIDGATRSTTSRTKPPGMAPSSMAPRAALTAPQLSWPNTTISGTLSTLTANSMEPRTAVSMAWPAVRTTNMSPRPWSKISSAATRLSEQPNTTAVGLCPAARLARCSTLWLGCCGFPATNRSLPSLSDFHAVTGLVLGMADIMPQPPADGSPLISVTDLLEWYRVARRDLPWRAPGVSAWQILVSEFMLQQTPVSRVLPIWPDWVRRWPTPSAPRRPRRRRAARLGQAGISAARQAITRVRHRDRARSRRRRSRRRRHPADAAGGRRLHRPRRRLLRLPTPGAGGGHQRAPGGGPRPVIPRRPGRRGGFRPTPEPTGRCADACWMCCAATILRSPGPSWTWPG